jgi:Protein of unknown function (DUF2510)
VVHLSGIQWVIVLGFSIAWAVLGYVLSENDRKNLGRTPWGLPSAVWAFLWFLSLIVGLILYLIAHSVGIRRAQQGSPVAGSPVAGPQAARPQAARPPLAKGAGPGGSPSVAERFPSYPQPANAGLAPTETPADTEGPASPVGSRPSVVGGAEVQQPGPQDPRGWPHSPPAWHPDPSGRFHFRWWDGHQWTSQVSTDGHHLIDTNPDQRIGPY